MTEENSPGWHVAPNAYAASRMATYDGARLISQYVAVRDGTQLAVDVHLPGDTDNGARFPAICVFTPYYRRFALREGHRNSIDACPTVAFYRDSFVKHGYALVAVDVRGSGASFGCRDGFRSPAERLDHHDIADWVSKQPWCDGNLGATGISYPGAAADFLASTCHPAVKAVAPLFAVWDTWSNHLYPGGVLLTCVSKNYGQLSEALDLDLRDQIPAHAYFKDDDLAGPAPVDADRDGAMLKAALKDHVANFEMQDFAQQLRFRDAALTDNPDYTSAKISPYNYASRDSDRKTAYYSISGWYDGGGYSVGTIQRYLWLENPSKRLMLGPWDHGARAHVSPWRPHGHAGQQQPFVAAEVLRFFDKHLKGVDNGLDAEAPVHYYTMGAEEWRSSDVWPVPAESRALYFSDAGALSERAPKGKDAADAYQGDYDCRTGFHSRYDRLYIANVLTYYDDWHGRDEKMIAYTGEPLAEDTEMTGQAVAHLHFACSEKDCAFFVYVADVTPEGKAVYVTEGVFRALHRAETELPAKIPATGPKHSYSMADAKHLSPDEPASASFELLPVSYLFRKGHRIRVAIAMADSDHFTRIPDGRPPKMRFFRDAQRPSRVDLPIVTKD